MSLVSRLLPGFLGLCLGLAKVHALGIPNPSFEQDRFTVWPGQVSANGSITGWKSSGSVGLNPAEGSPYANNGATPDGVNVAFIQSFAGTPGILSTTLTGLTKGRTYTLNFRANMRSGSGAPEASYSINGAPAVSFMASPEVGAQNPYYPISASFTATAPTAALVLKNAAASDTTLLVDDFRLALQTDSAGEEEPAPLVTESPAAAVTWMISTQGLYPDEGLDNDERFLGEIRLFAAGPETAGNGWLPCDGRSLPITQNVALYSLLGVIYGGNNQTTFHLPDLRGRIPIGDGQGPGLTNRVVGETGGGSTVLTAANLPPHSHETPGGSTTTAGAGTPAPIMPPYVVLRPWISTSSETPLLTGTVRWYAGYHRFPGRRCDGSALDTGSHAELFAKIGYTFGGGDATFHLPDLRGRMAIGCGEGDGLTPRTTGQKGGSDSYALTLADLPTHAHPYPGGSTAATGGTGSAAPAMPAYLVLNPAVVINGAPESSTSHPATGELRFFAVTPEKLLEDQGEEWRMWLPCQGGIIPTWESFSYLDAVGNLWGGDVNQGTMGIPDLRGRALACSGQAGSFPNRALAAHYGAESLSVNASHLPEHEHNIDLSTTTLLSRHYSAVPGDLVTFEATVKASDGVPTGEVSFYLGSTLLGTSPLDADGVATFTAGPFAAGAQWVRASYTGDADSCPSVSPPVLIHDAGWSVQPWTGDADSGISFGTQWAYRFGSNNSATIGGIELTGIAGPNPASAGKFTVAGMNLNHVSDTNELTALGGSGSAEIARTFVYNGNPGTITLQGLTAGKHYVATILSVGFDVVGNRKVTFTSGGASYEVDQGHYGNNRGIRLDYRFTADASTRDITLSPANAGRSWHLCALTLRELSQGFSVFNGNSTDPADQRVHNTGTVTFPDTLRGSSSAAKTFTLRNTGSVHLAGLEISKDGDHPDDFLLTSTGGTGLAPGETKLFTVVFAPTVDGARGATIHLEGLGAPFAIPVSGNAPYMSVTSLTDAALRSAIQTANSAAGPMTITFNVPGGGTLVLGSELPKLSNPHGIFIDGSNGGQGAIVIDAGSNGSVFNRIFFVGVTPDLPGMTPTPDTSFRIADLTLQNGRARGGSGGGGGAGMGGAIFLNAGKLELANVQFSDNLAIGGNGGSGNSSGSGGNGGIGTGAAGGTAATSGTDGEDVHPEGIAPTPGGAGEGGIAANGSGGGRGGNGGNGGNGGIYYGPGGYGGAGGNGGNGGNASFGGGGADGGSGGHGGQGGSAIAIGGINHAAGKGGKGGDGKAAGNGGFGGGGGGGGRGGNGGESGLGLGPGGTGGNGGNSGTSGTGGFGAGNGAAGGSGSAGSVSPSYNIRGAGGAGGMGGPGGGGAGLGGAVFVRQGATLTVKDGGIVGGGAHGGVGGSNGITTAGNGLGLGAALFLAGSATYEVTGSHEVTIADSFGGGIDPQISGGFTKKGTGSLVLGSSNSYIGGTLIEAGTLGLGHDLALGTTPLTINGGGLRAVNGPRFPLNPITANASFTLGTATYLMGSLALNGDITITSTNPAPLSGNSSPTLAGPISGAHSITFAEGVNPDDSISLTGANTYTGNTILAGGRVAIAGGQNVLPDGTTVIFSGASAVLELSKPEETVEAVYFGTTQLAAGTWGATGSGATYLNDVRFAGTGKLTVISGPTFESWAADKGLAGDDAGFDADPNNNGIVNGLEFVLGGEPLLLGATPLPVMEVNGSEVVFTFTRTDVSASFHPVVQFNTGLSDTWTTAVHGVNATIETTNGAPADTVRVRIPRNSREKVFVRLVAAM